MVLAFSVEKVVIGAVSKKNTNTYKKPTEVECNNNIDYCFDKYCFDEKTLAPNSYSKCQGTPMSTVFLNVEDCLSKRTVISELDLTTGCKDYSYNRVISLLANRDILEHQVKNTTSACQKATRLLESAKACFNTMINSSGESTVELYNRLEGLCGKNISGDDYIVNRFFHAGDYGESDITTLKNLSSIGSKVAKRENWRQIVDATLAGYTEIAELACGNEDYSLTKVNQYLLDKDKFANVKKEAGEYGRQVATSIVNYWFREMDCVNAALPQKGRYWSWHYGESPECKVVCESGYVTSANGLSCERDSSNDKSIFDNFHGLNLVTNWAAENTEQPRLVEKKKKIIITDEAIDDRDCIPTDKMTPRNDDNFTRESVCKIFFPKCYSGKTTNHGKWYCRDTMSQPGHEQFLIGPADRNYTEIYVNLTLAKIKKLFELYGNNTYRYGDGRYTLNTFVGGFLADICKNNCGRIEDEPEQEEEKEEEQEEQQKQEDTVSFCDDNRRFTEERHDISTSRGMTYYGYKGEDIDYWLEMFIVQDSDCQENQDVLRIFKTYKTSLTVEGMKSGYYYYNVRLDSIVDRFKQCVCRKPGKITAKWCSAQKNIKSFLGVVRIPKECRELAKRGNCYDKFWEIDKDLKYCGTFSNRLKCNSCKQIEFEDEITKKEEQEFLNQTNWSVPSSSSNSSPHSLPLTVIDENTLRVDIRPPQNN